MNGQWRAVQGSSLSVIQHVIGRGWAGAENGLTAAMPCPRTEYRRGVLWAGSTRFRSAPLDRTFEVWTVEGVEPPSEAVTWESWPAWTPPVVHPPASRRWASAVSMSADAHSVSFSTMTAEAEAELAEWDTILHGRPKNAV